MVFRKAVKRDINKEIQMLVLNMTVSFLLFFILIETFSNKEVIYDSWYYWVLADPCFENGNFNIMLFPETMRGYFLPVIFNFMKRYGEALFNSEWILFNIFNALQGAWIVSYIIPQIINVTCSIKRRIIGNICFVLLIFFFFSHLFTYPLSDIYAFTFVSTGFIMIWNMIKQQISYEKYSYSKIMLTSSLGGALTYAGYNTRTIYLMAILLFFVIISFLHIKKNKILLLTLVGCTVIGSLVVAIPQMKINNNYRDTYTPRVLTEQMSNYEFDLNSWQILQGMVYSRYETYVGETVEGQEAGGVRFIDKAGNQILYNEKFEKQYITIGEFISLFLKYPLDFIGIYVRSLVSYMTPIWTETYIRNLYVDKSFSFILNAIIWCISIGAIFAAESKKIISWLKINGPLLFVTILPCILLIVGAVEVRFFIPVYFLLYGFVCYNVQYKQIWHQFKQNPVKISIVYTTLLLLWIAVMGAVLSDSVVGVHIFGK